MKYSQLEKLEKQREVLSKKISEKKRELNYRRRYLIGVVIEKAIENGKLKQEHLDHLTNIYIKNKNDRELLSLLKAGDN